MQRCTGPNAALMSVVVFAAAGSACVTDSMAADELEAPHTPAVMELSGRVIVSHRSIEHWRNRGMTAQGAEARRAEARARIDHNLIRHESRVDLSIVRVPPGVADIHFIRQLVTTGDYEYVEPDWRVRAVAIPNDPSYNQQWHLPKIGAPAAWDITTGDGAVVIAVCDSGVDLDHPDLAGALVPGYNAVDQLAQIDGGLVDGLTNHGTQVAGSAGAVGDNNLGVSGVGWNLRIMPVRVSNLPNDTALISDINAGAMWAVDNGAAIINSSFSSVQTSSIQTTGEYIRDHGGVYVWAAGNASSGMSWFDHPDVFIVGATDQNDNLASFSNFGRAVDMTAPGVDIFTTNLGGYGSINGTSFAAPITAGVMGLALSANDTLTPQALEAILTSTAIDLGDAGDDDVFGHGRVNAFGAVTLADAAASTDLPPLAFDDFRAGFNGGQLAIDVMSNDIDLNGDAINIADFDLETGAGGSVRQAGDHLLYQPAPGFEGVDSFAYTIEDEAMQPAEAAVDVIIARVPVFAQAFDIETPGFGLPLLLHTVDFDNDGDRDLIATYQTVTNPISIFANDGAGGFTHVGFAAANGATTPTNIAFGDLNNDGCLDVVCADSIGDEIGYAFGDCAGGFTAYETIAITNPDGIVIANVDGSRLDFNGDGLPDMAVSTQGFQTNFIQTLLADPQGGFVQGDSFAPLDVAGQIVAADFNGDKTNDLAVSGVGLGFLTVVLTNPQGDFMSVVEYPAGARGEQITAADIDDDGDLDVLVVSAGLLGSAPGAHVFLNDGHGVFTPTGAIPTAGQFPRSLAASDLDADGDIDVVTANMLSNTVSVHANVSNEAFSPIAFEMPTPAGAFAVVAHDFDDDGDAEIVVSITGIGSRHVLLFENLTDPVPDNPADLNGDGVVDPADLAIVLGNWGACPPPTNPCDADLTGDGAVGPADLAIVLGNWG